MRRARRSSTRRRASAPSGEDVNKPPAIEPIVGAHRHIGEAAPAIMIEEIEGRKLAGIARLIFALAAIVATFLALNQLLNLRLFVGVVFIENRYLFLLAAALFPLGFPALPGRKGATGSVPVYDWVLAALGASLLFWFAFLAERIP